MLLGPPPEVSSPTHARQPQVHKSAERAAKIMNQSAQNLTVSNAEDDLSDSASLWSRSDVSSATNVPSDVVKVGSITIPTDAFDDGAEKPLHKRLNVVAPKSGFGVSFVPHPSFSKAVPRWAKLSDVQTVLGSLYKSRTISTIKYTREQVLLPDGDFVDIDFADLLPGNTFKGSKFEEMVGAPIVLLVHGLGGNSGSSYIALAARELGKQGIRAVALNMRGSSGRPNLAMRMYHACAYEDVEFVLNHLLKKYPGAPVGVMGFSLGGCITLNLMGRRAKQLDPRIVCAATISPPLDLLTGSVLIQTGPGKKWTGYLLAGLRALLKPRLEDLRTGCGGKYPIPAGFDVDKAYSAKTIKEFDQYFIAPLHGYANTDDYYTKASPIPYLEDINRPLLVIRSRDDPFLAPNDVHVSALSSNEFIDAILTERGGHIGFMARDKDSFWPWRLQCFAEPTAAQFFADKFAAWIQQRNTPRGVKVASIGSVNVDLCYEISRLPIPGETMGVNGFSTSVGGKGANQAVAARRMVKDVSLIACVGEDAFGTRALGELMAWGVDTSRVHRSSNATGTAAIFLQASGENSVLIVPGANSALSVDLLSRLDYDVVLLQLECPYEVNLHVMRHCRTVLNPSPLPEDPARMSVVREMVAQCTCLIVNEVELARLGGDAMELIGLGNMEAIIVTLGSKGGYCFLRDGAFIQWRSKQVAVVDTTGAGDCFAGTFAALWGQARLKGVVPEPEMKRILDISNGVAALSVQMKGTMDSYACRSEFASGKPQDRCDRVELLM